MSLRAFRLSNCRIWFQRDGERRRPIMVLRTTQTYRPFSFRSTPLNLRCEIRALETSTCRGCVVSRAGLSKAYLLNQSK